MSCSEEEDAPVEEVKRGRPVGKVDQKPRYRRTAQQISDDKIRIAQMKLDAVREAEGKRMATKKARRPAKVSETTLTPRPPKPPERERSESPKRAPLGTRRQALYDSWFPSSPRTKHW